MNISISESVKADEYFSRVFLSEKSVSNREFIFILRSCKANNRRLDKKFIREKITGDQKKSESLNIRKEKGSFPFSIFIAVGSMDSIHLNRNCEDLSDGTGLSFSRIGGAYKLSELFNGIFMPEDHYKNRSRRHEFHQSFKERSFPVDFIESFGLQLGAGASTSPFGAMPIVSGAVTWKKVVYVEATVGHTFWKNSFQFAGSDLTTRRRMSGASLIVYPFHKYPIGIVGGWLRIEEISQLYYKYVQMSEGPLLGLRVTPFEYLSITGSFNPSRHRLAGELVSISESDQFLISIMVHKLFGGEK